MTEFITAGTLASYPGVGLAESEIPAIVVELINDLVDEIVVDTTGITDLSPIPPKIRAIALEAAARSIDPARASGASSVTEGLDDWKKTVRYEGVDGKFKAGIYLTDEEEADIRAALTDDVPAPVGSIRLHVPGYGRGSYAR